MTLGSLFDGAGTFPFAASAFGILPIWASEIEPFPIQVTQKRLPKMKHLGDITKIDGSAITPVDVITFGSPCQDLSVAGKRAGLDGERSGLFLEAIRIIKEMRRKTNGKYPRYAVWENVPGAFSSNKGEDFRTVLEEFCKIKDDTTIIPRPAEKGKWRTAGLILADGYSIAWRVLDAQFWGVPQRRRRIFLVADFGGGSAGEILFEQDGLSRNFAESRKAWQATSSNGTDDFARTNHRITSPIECVGFDPYNSALTGNVAATLGTNCGFTTGRNAVIICKRESNQFKRIIRRFTPLECCRLNGMPDWWCQDLEQNDSAEYIMWGNGMALPCVLYVMQGIAKHLRKSLLEVMK